MLAVQSPRPATATRPPAKPLRRSSPVRSTAKHHLEPNPFEKSFSSGPTSSESIDRRADLKAAADSKPNLSTPPLSTRPGAAYRDRTFSNSKSHTSPQESASTPKPLLPPVASITSPAGESNPYPWSAGLTSSLRSGPLSPAMLAGPQSSHFDPNSFRTGFTPDLSNFKTGLTPLGGGMSFPPPSPNTAAFLAAMVNNTSAAASTSAAATITPNTLSALTNAAAAAATNPGGSMDPTAAAGAVAPGAALSTQPQNFAAKPTDAHNAFDLAFSRSFPNERADAAKLAGSKLKAELRSGDSDRSLSQSISPQMVQKPLENGDQQNAASGLFLLSRAHQEMSKRDGASAASTSLYESKPAAASAAAGKKGAAAKSKAALADDAAAAAAKPNGNKRKKSNSTDDATVASTSFNAPPAKAAKTAKGGKKGAAAAAAAASAASASANAQARDTASNGAGASYKSENGGDDDDQQWDSDDENGDGKGHMDEKRKNFLERNRQAALKCRQRKKAWLASLQAKVEYLQNDNENLQNTVGALRNENMFLKSQLVQATGGAPLPAMPMGMPMGLPMAPPPPHGVDPHHSMGPSPMGIPASMAPHPAYMHPGASGPPMTQGPGAYAPAHAPPHGVPRGGAPGFGDAMQQQSQQQPQRKAGGGRPRSEGDVLAPTAGDQPMNGAMKHEREWSAAADGGPKNGGGGASGSAGGATATIKV
ncbi:related to transcription factor ATFA [Sporisorium reilianum SRZ2]|uniref:Related to transcription factor ATFA n=1 Tax=Sporisorium reilianum (strain SRZ2) TaxID=999809 RepID=E6ZWM6_SPORE|nr:related to transcription factor ATFA [Sporisorium reilianum SRZ2]